MSTNSQSGSDESDDDQQQYRQVARRSFAAEYADAGHMFKESDEERAPNFALLPTGHKMNRAFFVGTLTETDDVGNDDEYWQGRVVDPTGTFFVYAGQYQPEAMSILRELEPPAYVAVLGKPRSYETDSGEINVTVRPERITVVDSDVRNHWVVETADRTMDRIVEFRDGTSPYFDTAVEQYEPDMQGYLGHIAEALDSLQIDD
jgi:RPA family protein